MSDIEIKRGYEVLPDNNIRFGIRITNVSDLAISDVEVILDYTESLFKLEGDRMQKAGNIPPSGSRTIEYILKPLGCVHQVNIEALISYRDAKWKRQRIDMPPKEVHCVCPFLKQKTMSMGEFHELFKSGHRAETGLNFQGVGTDKLVHFLEQTCKNWHYKIDEIDVDGGKMLYLASESIGEKAYYLLTAFIKETDDATQVMLMVVSDKPHGLSGFLNEMVESLRHVVGTVHSAREIGIIKKEQVINIIDSVVQRTSFAGGDGGSSINIQDSVVQRTEFNAVDEEKKNREEAERLQKEEEERQRKEREEQERIKREKKEREERELLKKQKEEEEEQERRKREAEKIKLHQWQEKNTSTNTSLPQNRFVSKQESNSTKLEKEREEAEKKKVLELNKGGSGKFFAVVLVLGMIIFGYFMFNVNIGPSIMEEHPAQTPEVTPTSTLTSTPTPTPSLTQSVTLGENEKTITNSIGMEFVLIPAGEFDMGSPSNEVGRYNNEGPVHSVTISNAYYMGKYEVTIKQWRDVMRTNPSNWEGDNLPVESVSWNDAQEFIKKLNQKEGADKYRFPSEAEWEYAVRAGTTTRYYFGDDAGKLGNYAWYDDNSGSRPHPVGEKRPNSWGLYDMHGNVWEWVQDSWHGDYNGAPTDGSAWESGGGSLRVLRGGSWSSFTRYCQSAGRCSFDPSSRDFNVGFRLLMEVSDTSNSNENSKSTPSPTPEFSYMHSPYSPNEFPSEN